jgi:hypothetical protein
VASNTFKGKAEFVNYSFDVKVDGKNVPRLLDPMIHNKLSSPNTAPFPELQAPVVVVVLDETKDVEIKCPCCEEELK